MSRFTDYWRDFLFFGVLKMMRLLERFFNGGAEAGYRVLLMAIPLLLFSLNAFPQRYNFTIYNTGSGLPGNQINDVIQDRHGRIWVGTMNGVSRFDGIEFSKFDKLNPISSSPVKTLFEDSRGNIWIGMINGGVCRYSGTGYEFFNTGNGLLSDIVYSVAEDQEGNIWIGTSEGLNRFDGKLMHGYTTMRGLVNNTIFNIYPDSKGNIWLATLGGISKFDGKGFINYTAQEGLLSNICYHITESNRGRLWISTYLGISVFDGASFENYTTENGLMTERVEKVIENHEKKKMFASYGSGVGIIDDQQIRYITVEDGLPSNIVKSLIQDREGNYWFGTWNGLCKYNSDRFVQYTHEDGLSNNNILSVAVDSAGTVFAGTLTGGVNYLKNGSIFTLGTESGLRGLSVWSVYITPSGKYWFGTTGGPALLDTSTMQFTHPFPELDKLIIYSILEDFEGRLHFGTDKGLFTLTGGDSLVITGKEEGLTDDKIRVLFEDRDRRLWIGTMKNLYYIEDKKVVNFNKKFNIPDAPVTSIIQDSTGRILVSTYDFGVFLIGDGIKSSMIQTINRASGLHNDRILFNLLDPSGQRLWLGTTTGLAFVDWKKYLDTGQLAISRFDKSNGYPGVESNSAYADKRGYIWFATVNGLIRHKTSAEFHREVLPLLWISDFETVLNFTDWRNRPLAIDPHTALPLNPILPHNNNHIRIHYSGIYLTAPSEVKYQHILEGFDEDWAAITNQTSANYSNLPPGNYIFKVKATANGLEWTSPVTYSFEIKPPYYKTPFFYFLYAITISSSLFLILKLRTRNLNQTQMMLRQKVEQRTRELNQKNIELEKLSVVASETGNSVLIFDENSDLEWANEGFSRMTGFTMDDFIQRRGRKLPGVTFYDDAGALLDNCIANRKSASFESKVRCRNGSEIWTSSMLTPILSGTSDLKKVVVIQTDITYRRKMEEQIRASLEEKELLLREIHHRVKNNLQIIISLFNLQSHYVNDQKAFAALKEGQDRIKSMALIHERFYQNEGLMIDFDEYIKRLVENLLISFNITPGRITYKINAEKISLDIDSAVPCGLIINELVSNSIKHGFSEEEQGEILIGFHSLQDGKVELTVRDTGKGLPDDFNVEESDSLGMQLINALANQLDGNLLIEPGPGAFFRLIFTPVHEGAGTVQNRG